jgi:hypothetical protein
MVLGPYSSSLQPHTYKICLNSSHLDFSGHASSAGDIRNQPRINCRIQRLEYPLPLLLPDPQLRSTTSSACMLHVLVSPTCLVPQNTSSSFNGIWKICRLWRTMVAPCIFWRACCSFMEILHLFHAFPAGMNKLYMGSS